MPKAFFSYCAGATKNAGGLPLVRNDAKRRYWASHPSQAAQIKVGEGFAQGRPFASHDCDSESCDIHDPDVFAQEGGRSHPTERLCGDSSCPGQAARVLATYIF